jgi:ribosomal subunit interface protein
MTLRVTGKNFAVGDAFRTHVQDRIGAAIAKYFSGTVKGHVMVAHEGAGYRTECTLHLSSGMTLETEGTGHEVYACFDQSADRLEKRLRRYKRRLKDHHGAPATVAAADSPVFTDYVIEPPRENEVEDFAPVTIAEKTTLLRHLTVADAVLELDLTGTPVMVFRHAGHGRVNIVYRRTDGNIGWIDPDAVRQ